MAAASYQDLTRQIDELRRKAEQLREKEKPDVIRKIRAAIETYGITVDDLFGAEAKATRTTGKARKNAGRTAPSKPTSGQIRFRDGAGNEWVGRGPQPSWFKAALAAGMTREQLAVT
jgi:DNA-binding protein H-NS